MIKKYFLFCLFFFNYIFSSFSNDVFDKLDATSKFYLQKVTNAIKNGSDKLLQYLDRHPFSVKNGKSYVSLLIEASDVPDSNELLKLECKEIIYSGNIVSLKIPIEYLNVLTSKDWVVKVNFSRRYKINLDKSRSEIRADLVHNGIGLPHSFQGENVIIGIFDTGIDFYHPDFSDDNGTRILYLWDMSAETGSRPPNGFDWGIEYTKYEIDVSPSSVLQKDYNGHGTHVAGIAAGNGSGKQQFKGIAPKSKLIIVKGLRDPYDDSFNDGDIIAGCKYIFSKADSLGLPCVINLSLGGFLGSHDGNDLLSKALDNLVTEKRGRVIVASAGNAGEYEIHSGGVFSAGEKRDLLVNPINLCYIFPEMCPDDPNYFMTGGDVWTDKEVLDSIFLYVIDRSSFDFFFIRGFSANSDYSDIPLFSNDNSLLGFFEQWTTQEEDSKNLQFFITNKGDTTIQINKYFWIITMLSKNSGRVDIWAALPIGSQYQISTLNPRFPSDNFMTIVSPAVAKTIVSVGSYVSKNSYVNIFHQEVDWSSHINIREVSSFSSRGPSRDGRTLPTILAPGEYIFSALANSINPFNIDSTLINLSGIYIGKRGTSMSAPHVAGAIALLFEFNPDLDYSQIKELIKLSGREDSFTGNLPNNIAGWGKIDVIKLLQKITSVKSPIIKGKDFYLYPNPTDGIVNIQTEGYLEDIEILDFLGKKLFVPFDHNVLNLTYASPGVYFLKIKIEGEVVTKLLLKF